MYHTFNIQYILYRYLHEFMEITIIGCRLLTALTHRGEYCREGFHIHFNCISNISFLKQVVAPSMSDHCITLYSFQCLKYFIIHPKSRLNHFSLTMKYSSLVTPVTQSKSLYSLSLYQPPVCIFPCATHRQILFFWFSCQKFIIII